MAKTTIKRWAPRELKKSSIMSIIMNRGCNNSSLEVQDGPSGDNDVEWEITIQVKKATIGAESALLDNG